MDHFKAMECKLTLIPILVRQNSIPACDDGFYGVNCVEQCGHCSDIRCDAVTGLCSGSCSPGWLGEDCKRGNSTYFLSF